MAKTGNGGYFFAFTTSAIQAWPGPFAPLNGILFQIANPFYGITSGTAEAAAALTVNQAYAIDTKIDDGWPLTGNIVVADPGIDKSAAMSIGLYASADGNWEGYASFVTSKECPTPNYSVSLGGWPYNLQYLDNINCSLIIRTAI